MDYVVLSALATTPRDLAEYTVSYDVACQWSKHFLSRIVEYPRQLQVDLQSKTLTYAVPDMHVMGHGEDCQDDFSFQWLPGAGQTCGEGIEQGWATYNALATSTREMSSGARSDTLDDHLGEWNWRKTTRLPQQLRQGLQRALREVVTARRELEVIESKLDAGQVEAFAKRYAEYLLSHRKPCPWRSQVSGERAGTAQTRASELMGWAVQTLP